ncbi:hypothetical protein TorRG33x02_187050 [Trema orientale]|uniref:Uncharacterized protein n=1 Tax=Trema orientale TaxID=63057 RepID=A0A2P5EJ36_TREOI|nr:hypothetical protein TorRG33x02_187050 [Trema orientale]
MAASEYRRREVAIGGDDERGDENSDVHQFEVEGKDRISGRSRGVQMLGDMKSTPLSGFHLSPSNGKVNHT